jgi:hypothetical protein
VDALPVDNDFGKLSIVDANEDIAISQPSEPQTEHLAADFEKKAQEQGELDDLDWDNAFDAVDEFEEYRKNN